MKRLAALTAGAALAVAPAAAQAHDLTSSQKRLYKHRWQLSAYKVDWYTHRGRWTLRRSFDRCAQIKWPRPRGRCFRHRENLRWHRERMNKIGRRLWSPRPATTTGPSWLVAAFLCIHRYEGAWNANTGNGYEGGLQFGHDEWQTYGGQYAAHAYDASPAQQIAAAIAYHAVSGFSPWPNTARACGLT